MDLAEQWFKVYAASLMADPDKFSSVHATRANKALEEFHTHWHHSTDGVNHRWVRNGKSGKPREGQ
jgi:hypothetical protein